MKKFYLALSVMFCSFLLGTFSADAASTRSDNYMPQGTVVYPSGDSPYVTSLYKVELSWDYEEIEMTEPGESNYYGEVFSATPASLSVPGFEEKIDVYPYVGEKFLYYEETPDGDYNYYYGYILALSFYDIEESLLEELNLSNFPYGKYTLTFPAGMVKNVLGELNPEQTVELIYMQTPDYDTESFTPPARDSSWQGIEYDAADLKEVTLTWANMPITLNENSSPATVSEYSWMGDTPKTPFIVGDNLILNDSKDALVFDLSTLPEGRWTVLIPQGFVFLGEDQNMINDEVQATYTISTSSGVASLEKDANGRWVVYNLKGMLVLDTDKESELKNLEPGLYIINGEKVLIRR